MKVEVSEINNDKDGVGGFLGAVFFSLVRMSYDLILLVYLNKMIGVR